MSNKPAESALKAAEAASQQAQQRSVPEIEAERLAIGGYTAFVNRYLVQSYPDGSMRLVFMEQYSGSLDAPPAFRTAVFLHGETARGLAQQILSVPQSEKA
jgi:hypothetical protein